MNPPFSIRDVRDEDCQAITELCLRSKASWGYDTAFMAQCRETLTVTPPKLQHWLTRVAVSNDGRLWGVAAVSIMAANEREVDAPSGMAANEREVDAELELLFVEPAVMRAGIGRALMHEMRTLASGHGARTLWILSDPGAERFYLGLGAVRAGLRPSESMHGRNLPWLRLFLGGPIPSLTTRRLRLRPWRDDDLAPFAALNADPRVTRFLPGALRRDESDALAARIRADFDRYGFGLWAVERVDGSACAFIGFVGLSVPRFAAPFTPCVEIGWRLAPEHWGAGIATEAAHVVAAHAFRSLRLDELVSFTLADNAASRRVMEKIGMRRDPLSDFDHPLLPAAHRLRRHVLYRLKAQPA